MHKRQLQSTFFEDDCALHHRVVESEVPLSDYYYLGDSMMWYESIQIAYNADSTRNIYV